MRTCTTVFEAHTSQWLGTFGNAGNGEYRAELLRAVAALQHYIRSTWFQRRGPCYAWMGGMAPGRSLRA